MNKKRLKLPVDLEFVVLDEFIIKVDKPKRVASGTLRIQGEEDARVWSLRYSVNRHGGRKWTFETTTFAHSRRINNAIKLFLKQQIYRA